MLVLFLERVGIREYPLLDQLGGLPQVPAWVCGAFAACARGVKSSLCEDCQRRTETNPLRVLDCKVEADQPVIDKLPHFLDYLGPECRQHFARVTSELQARGLAYQVAPRLVRGLDCYTRTTFEITSGASGRAERRCWAAGGTTDLSEMLGGPPTPGFGFSIGQDRLMLAVEAAAVLEGRDDRWRLTSCGWGMRRFR